jgi:F-type H+-transporting ATPase subunit b
MILGGVVFLILLYLVSKFVTPRFEQAFAERTKAIEGGLKQAEEMQAQAKAALEQYQEQLAQARHEAARIRQEAKEEGAAIVAEMRAQAQEEAQRIIAAAQAQIEAERQRAVGQIRAEVGDLAIQLASRIVGETLEDEVRQRRIVERFLEEIEREPAGEPR